MLDTRDNGVKNSDTATTPVLWTPEDNDRVTSVEKFMNWLNSEHSFNFNQYDQLLDWSVVETNFFWSLLWDFFNLPGKGLEALPHNSEYNSLRPDWFPNARLNYAERMLMAPGVAESDMAVVAISDTRDTTEYITFGELRSLVANLRAGLIDEGVRSGDVVACYMPNVPETLVLMLATASLGAIFTSCAPEFGTTSVLDRWKQVQPKIVFGIDGYRYGKKIIDRRDDLLHIRRELPSVETLVVLPYLDPNVKFEGVDLYWNDLLKTGSALEFERVNFSHPLYVLFSSGTTGLPKAIVHGHGGITIEHLKTLAFAHDIQRGDRAFWQTTTGWMMWNLVVSSLGLGSAVILTDVAPAHPDVGRLWRIAAEVGITHFGTSPAFLQLCKTESYKPIDMANTTSIRELGLTGTSSSAELEVWATKNCGKNIRIMSSAGGTDVCSGFVGDSAAQPVLAGRMASRFLGCDIRALSDAGSGLVGEQGELVVAKPLPSMPVFFWGDTDGDRYFQSYFSTFPGVWRHGDWITIWEDGTCYISGRSDATLNRGGIRIGTAEYYEVLESVPGIEDALVIHLETGSDGDGLLMLFLVTSDSLQSSVSVKTIVRETVLSELSPRHLPDCILRVDDIPRNLTGKRMEVPIKRMMQGNSTADVITAGSMQNPSCLAQYEEIASNHISQLKKDTKHHVQN